MEIEELRKRLEEIQNMDDITDLTDEVLLANFPSENLREAQKGLPLGENEDWARDINIALGEEKDRKAEKEETLDFQRRQELEKEIADIKASREAMEKKLKTTWMEEQRRQAKEARRKMQEAAKKDYIREVKGMESDLQTAMQKNDTYTKEQVETKKAEINALNAEIAKIEEEIKEISAAKEVNKDVLKLTKNDKSSQVYQAAEREKNNCVKRASRRNKKIKEMNSKIEGLQGEIQQLEEQGKAKAEMLQAQFGKVSEILSEIDEERIAQAKAQAEAEEKAREEERKRVEAEAKAKDEIAKQEDKMWAEYRAEQEKEEKERKAKIDREIDKGYEEKHEKDEEIEARIIGEGIQQTEQYADGLNPEPDTSAEPKKTEEQDKTNSVPPTSKQKPQQPTKPKPPTKQGQKPDTHTKSGQTGNWKIEKATLMFGSGDVPYYKVILVDKDDENKKEEFTSADVVILNGEEKRKEMENLSKDHVEDAEKYYDKGLAKILTAVDEEYGTNGLADYKKLLQDKHVINKNPDAYEDLIRIEYDFSDSTKVIPDKKIRELKKIAKRCDKKGVAFYYEQPNIFKRILNSLTSKIKLLEGAKPEKNASEEKVRGDSAISAAEKWRAKQHIKTPIKTPKGKEEDKEKQKGEGAIKPDKILDEDGNEIHSYR